MAQLGIVPQHQILNNQASFAYKTKIELTKMTHKLVPPDDHCCNLAKKAIQNVQGPHDQCAQRMLAHHAYASLVPASPPD
jgi:hypothetical protein